MERPVFRMAGNSFITRLQDELQSGDAQFRPHFQVTSIRVDVYARGGWRVWDMVAHSLEVKLLDPSFIYFQIGGNDVSATPPEVLACNIIDAAEFLVTDTGASCGIVGQLLYRGESRFPPSQQAMLNYNARVQQFRPINSQLSFHSPNSILHQISTDLVLSCLFQHATLQSSAQGAAANPIPSYQAKVSIASVIGYKGGTAGIGGCLTTSMGGRFISQSGVALSGSGILEGCTSPFGSVTKHINLPLGSSSPSLFATHINGRPSVVGNSCPAAQHVSGCTTCRSINPSVSSTARGPTTSNPRTGSG